MQRDGLLTGATFSAPGRPAVMVHRCYRVCLSLDQSLHVAQHGYQAPHSMTRIVKFELENGTHVFVEAEDLSQGGEVRVGRGELIATARQKFDQAIAVITPVANALVTRLSQLVRAPNEVKIEFGVKLTAETGAIIAKTEAEANFMVSLSWKRDKEGD
jgi:hypothetical protein